MGGRVNKKGILLYTLSFLKVTRIIITFSERDILVFVNTPRMPLIFFYFIKEP